MYAALIDVLKDMRKQEETMKLVGVQIDCFGNMIDGIVNAILEDMKVVGDIKGEVEEIIIEGVERKRNSEMIIEQVAALLNESARHLSK